VTSIVRPRDRQWERYERTDDKPLGFSIAQSLDHVVSWESGGPMGLFLFDDLKRIVLDHSFEAVVGDDELDGRRLKVIHISFRGFPGSLIYRYWVDLARSGQVVRKELYRVGQALLARTDVSLARFLVDGDEVWLPVSAIETGYTVLMGTDRVSQETSTLVSTRVIDGSVVFNQHPGPDTFTFKYSPTVPVSDELAQLRLEFSRQAMDQAAQPSITESLERRIAFLSHPPTTGLPTTNALIRLEQPVWLVGSLGAILLASPIAARRPRRNIC
jgi:hypothetical protein